MITSFTSGPPPLRKKSRGGRGKEIEGEREGSKHFIYRGRRGWGLIAPPLPLTHRVRIPMYRVKRGEGEGVAVNHILFVRIMSTAPISFTTIYVLIMLIF